MSPSVSQLLRGEASGRRSLFLIRKATHFLSFSAASGRWGTNGLPGMKSRHLAPPLHPPTPPLRSRGEPGKTTPACASTRAAQGLPGPQAV